MTSRVLTWNDLFAGSITDFRILYYFSKCRRNVNLYYSCYRNKCFSTSIWLELVSLFILILENFDGNAWATLTFWSMGQYPNSPTVHEQLFVRTTVHANSCSWEQLFAQTVVLEISCYQIIWPIMNGMYGIFDAISCR